MRRRPDQNPALDRLKLDYSRPWPSHYRLRLACRRLEHVKMTRHPSRSEPHALALNLQQRLITISFYLVGHASSLARRTAGRKRAAGPLWACHVPTRMPSSRANEPLVSPAVQVRRRCEVTCPTGPL